jgi:tight adherence protein C
MVWLITIITFVGTMGVLLALFYSFASGSIGVAERLGRLNSAGTPPPPEVGFGTKQREKMRDVLASLGKILPASDTKAPRTVLLMVRAGYRSPEAILALRAVKFLFPAFLLALVFFTGFYKQNTLIILLVAAGLGYLFPEMWLSWKVSARQHRLRLSLPDGLDLLVICVEAGLGLDQALMKVAQELRTAHRELSEELQLVNLEMRIGKSRIETLRELARRTGLDDIKSLAAMLIQTDRFGTSVAQSLRAFSDDMRVRRRQRAEEMAAKTSVKMVPPLVFFIFPALMVIILGPAVLTVMRQLMPALHR